jgi:hypothetical protein
VCVIICAPKGEGVVKEVIDNAVERNPDWWGMAALSDDGKMTVERGFGKVDAWKAWRKYPNKYRVFHARIGTSGTVGVENSHPFDATCSQVPDKPRLLFHNGMLRGLPMFVPRQCDTWHFSIYLQKWLPGNKALYDAIEAYAQDNHSRFVLMETDGVHIFGSGWIKADNVMYSGTSAIGGVKSLWGARTQYFPDPHIATGKLESDEHFPGSSFHMGTKEKGVKSHSVYTWEPGDPTGPPPEKAIALPKAVAETRWGYLTGAGKASYTCGTTKPVSEQTTVELDKGGNVIGRFETIGNGTAKPIAISFPLGVTVNTTFHTHRRGNYWELQKKYIWRELTYKEGKFIISQEVYGPYQDDPAWWPVEKNDAQPKQEPPHLPTKRERWWPIDKGEPPEPREGWHWQPKYKPVPGEEALAQTGWWLRRKDADPKALAVVEPDEEEVVVCG